PCSVIVVVGNHANAPQTQQYPYLATLLTTAAQTRGYVAFVTVEGQPTVFDGAGAIVGSDAPTQRVRDEENAAWVNGLLELYATQIVATTPESDPLEALRLANRALASAPAGERHIVVVDSGLATVGPLSFTQEDMIYAWPNDVAGYLEYIEALVSLDGVSIDWFGMGDVAAPQAPLTNRQRNSLRDIWAAIITRGGGSVTFHDDAPGTAVIAGLPLVSTVDLEPDPLPQLIEADAPVFFDEGTLHFVPNEAVFLDPDEARAILRPYARLLAQNPALQVHLVGTTATFWGDSNTDAAYELSQARAQAVCDLLVELGAPRGQMETEGQAYFDRWHLEEFDASGNYLPNIATQNRKVVLVEAHSDHDCVL
ncbi:MAG: OmpA family protein, partial [Coriobacteriales bacterium]|nr:OmpA family protein [Coriobacteriales bacterium]